MGLVWQSCRYALMLIVHAGTKMLHDLPQEVALSILEKLSTRQRAKVVLVSGEWRAIVTGNWDSICVNTETVLQLAKLFDWLPQIAEHGQQYLRTIQIDSRQDMAWPGKTLYLHDAPRTGAARLTPSKIQAHFNHSVDTLNAQASHALIAPHHPNVIKMLAFIVSLPWCPEHVHLFDCWFCNWSWLSAANEMLSLKSWPEDCHSGLSALSTLSNLQSLELLQPLPDSSDLSDKAKIGFLNADMLPSLRGLSFLKRLVSSSTAITVSPAIWVRQRQERHLHEESWHYWFDIKQRTPKFRGCLILRSQPYGCSQLKKSSQHCFHCTLVEMLMLGLNFDYLQCGRYYPAVQENAVISLEEMTTFPNLQELELELMVAEECVIQLSTKLTSESLANCRIWYTAPLSTACLYLQTCSPLHCACSYQLVHVWAPDSHELIYIWAPWSPILDDGNMTLICQHDDHNGWAWYWHWHDLQCVIL